MAGVAQQVTFDLRRDLSLKIDRLPLRYFDTRTHGEVLSRFSNDVDTVSQTLNQALSQIVTSLTTIVGILIMMLTISWQMTIVALLILPLSFFSMRAIIRRSQRFFVEQQACARPAQRARGGDVLRAHGDEGFRRRAAFDRRLPRDQRAASTRARGNRSSSPA